MAEPRTVSDTIAQAVFGLLFETSADAAFIVDRGGTVVAANLRMADLFACGVEHLIGKQLTDLTVEPDRDLLQPGHFEEVGFACSDGYPVYVELRAAWVDVPGHGTVGAYMARDTSERRALERELQNKHTALYTAHSELERTHSALEITKLELETRNHEIALLAWRAAMGELVAGIAHHLNNPVGALASTIRRLEQHIHKLPAEVRSEHERLLSRIVQITRRIESNVAAIVKASQSNALDDMSKRPELPPELVTVLATFVERLDDIPTKESA